MFFNSDEYSLTPREETCADGTVKIYGAQIETTRLLMRPIDATKDRGFYERLFGQAENMRLYLDGIPRDQTWINQRFNMWCERWAKANPFSAFVIEHKLNKVPIGHAISGECDQGGVSSCAIVLDKPFWGMKYASEVLNAAIMCWFPYLVSRKQQVCQRPFSKVHAKTLTESFSGVHLLKKYGFVVDQNSLRKRQLTRDETYAFVDESDYYMDLQEIDTMNVGSLRTQNLFSNHVNTIKHSSSLAVKTPAGNRLQLLRQIGSGGYGFVLEVIDENGYHSALKMVPVISGECEHASDTSHLADGLEHANHSSIFEFQGTSHLEKRSDDNSATTETSIETPLNTVTTHRKQRNSNFMNEIAKKNIITNEAEEWIFESTASADSLPAKFDESNLDTMEQSDYEVKQARREALFHLLNTANQCSNIVHSICPWFCRNLTKSEFCEYRNTMKAKLNVKYDDAASSRIVHYAHEHSKITVYMMQMQFYPMGSLERWLSVNQEKFSDTYEQRVCILRGTLIGLAYIHDHGLMHRDLCPSNVLLEECNGQIVAKISDFGTTISCGAICSWKLTKTRDIHTSDLGTHPYCAPEVRTNSYDYRCDLFSFGTMVVKTMWNVQTNQELVQMQNELMSDEAEKLLKNLRILPYSEDWLVLVQSLVTIKYQTRPSCNTLLQKKVFSVEKEAVSINFKKQSKKRAHFFAIPKNRKRSK